MERLVDSETSGVFYSPSRTEVRTLWVERTVKRLGSMNLVQHQLVRLPNLELIRIYCLFPTYSYVKLSTGNKFKTRF